MICIVIPLKPSFSTNGEKKILQNYIASLKKYKSTETDFRTITVPFWKFNPRLLGSGLHLSTSLSSLSSIHVIQICVLELPGINLPILCQAQCWLTGMVWYGYQLRHVQIWDWHVHTSSALSSLHLQLNAIIRHRNALTKKKKKWKERKRGGVIVYRTQKSELMAQINPVHAVITHVCPYHREDKPQHCHCPTDWVWITRDFHKAASQKSGWRFKSLMRKPDANETRENSMSRHEEEALRETRLGGGGNQIVW